MKNTMLLLINSNNIMKIKWLGYKKEELIMRACLYARVSTEEERQVNTLVKQCKEARLAIEENGWDLPSDCEYIDEGKSGTTTKNRDAYKHLIEGDFSKCVQCA
jgi:hypothetical protein